MTNPAIIKAAALDIEKMLVYYFGKTTRPSEIPYGIARSVVAAVTPLIRADALEEAAKALAPFARAADVYHEERFAPSDEITGRFGKIVIAEELWCLRNLYTRLRAKHAPKAQGGEK